MSRILSIDIETTGLNPDKCQVIEFAAVWVQPDKAPNSCSHLAAWSSTICTAERHMPWR